MSAVPLDARGKLDQAATIMRQWRAEPQVFVRDVLRVEVVDHWQGEGLDAAAAGASGIGNAVNPDALMRLCLKASKGPGKSTELSWIGWWFLTCFSHPKGVAISITGDNLRDGLWTELAKWQNQSPFLKAKFRWNAERILAVDHPETWWLSARQWSKSATPEQQADTLAGLHADNVIILVDEAGGIPDGVVAAAEAGLANVDHAAGRHALLAQAGNPTHLSGPLYRACTQERRLWWVKEISGDPDDPNRAPRVSKVWAQEQIDKYGRESPWVLTNVFGKFPPASIDALLGVEDVTTAVARRVVERDFMEDPKVLGVDVARFGDDESCIVMRQGPAVFRPKVFRNLNLMQLTGQVVDVINTQHPDAVFIDVDGLGGGVVDRLHELNFQVTGIHGSGKPRQHRYLNKRAEMWMEMADWVKKRGALPDDAQLRAELPGPVYWFTSKGQLQLESKEEMKLRGLSSPNRGDALALTFAMPVARRALFAGRSNNKSEWEPNQED